MADEWPVASVEALEARGVLLVQDGNHGAYRPRASEIVTDGIPHIRAADIDDGGQIHFEGVQHIAESAWARIKKGRARGGDVLLTHKGTVGRVATVPARFDRVMCSPQTTFWRSLDSERLDQGFVSAFLRSEVLQGQLRRVMHESDMAPYVSLTNQRGLSVTLPPIADQRAIADVLGALDGKIESNRRVADAADAAWLTELTHTLREVSEVSVADLIAAGTLVVNDGYRAKNSELADAGIPFLRAGNLTAAGLALDNADMVPPDVVERAGFKVAHAWDTAFTSKGTVGRITLVGPEPEPFVYSPQICFWRSTTPDVLSPLVLHAWMRSARFVAQVDSVKGQTDMADYVSLRDQRAMMIDLPSESAQREGHEMAEPMARMACGLRREARAVAAIRDALLPKLVSGRIRVRSSEDLEDVAGVAVEAHGVEIPG